MAQDWQRISRLAGCSAFPPAWFPLPAKQTQSSGNLAQFTCKLFAIMACIPLSSFGVMRSFIASQGLTIAGKLHHTHAVRQSQ
jgi:hypothetical protein